MCEHAPSPPPAADGVLDLQTLSSDVNCCYCTPSPDASCPAAP